MVFHGRVCRGRKSILNVVKSKFMRSARDGIVQEMNIMMDGQVLAEVEVFEYLDGSGYQPVNRDPIWGSDTNTMGSSINFDPNLNII